MIRVLLCAYDEEREMRPLLSALADALSGGPPWSVLLVDDGSRDATVAEARAAEAAAGGALQLEVISKERNEGLGAALATGLARCAREAAPGDVIVTLDADNTHPPALIPALVARLEAGADLAIASRYEPGATVSGVPGYRRWLSDIGGLLLRVLLPVPGARDYTCCFRAYRAELLQRAFAVYGDDFVQESGFAAVADILLRLRPLGVRVAEVPLDLDYGRRVGASKMRVVSSATRMLRLAARRWREQARRPRLEASR